VGALDFLVGALDPLIPACELVFPRPYPLVALSELTVLS